MLMGICRSAISNRFSQSMYLFIQKTNLRRFFLVIAQKMCYNISNNLIFIPFFCVVGKMIDINEYVIYTNKTRLGNNQAIFKFPNGYGASLIQGPTSYGGDEGLFELGVLTFSDDGWELCYTTSIVDDVIGYLTDVEVEELLNKIYELESIQ